MSVHDPSAPRKPKRFWLYAPYVAVLIAAALWSLFWAWEQHQLVARMDAAVVEAGRAGYQIDWRTRKVGGYPFRLDVALTDVQVREASGWALSAPRIEAEAQAYAPTTWVIAAPESLTFVRPESGPVTLTGDLIRASLSHFSSRPPRLSFEGVKLAFRTPPDAARPFALTSAERVEFHLRAGPDDEGGVFATVTGGRARLSGLFARIAADKAISFEWNSTLSKMSAFHGHDWAEAVAAWSAAGGRMTVRKAGLTVGDALIAVDKGALAAGRDGRLEGDLQAALRQAPRALAAMADTGLIPPETAQSATVVAQARQGQGDVARAAITFQAGRTTLGPISLGAAPRVYTPR